MKRKRDDQLNNNNNSENHDKNDDHALRQIFKQIRHSKPSTTTLSKKKRALLSSFTASGNTHRDHAVMDISSHITKMDDSTVDLRGNINNLSFYNSINVDNSFDCISQLQTLCKQQMSDDNRIYAVNEAEFYAKCIAFKLFHIQNEWGANKDELVKRVGVLMTATNFFLGQHKFNRTMFLNCLSHPSRYLSNIEYQVIDIRIIQVLDQNQIVTFEEAIEFCAQSRATSESLISRLSELNKSDPSIDHFLKVLLNLYTRDKRNKSAHELISALRKWKSDYYKNGHAVTEVYLSLLNRAMSDTDFLLRELTTLLSSPAKTKNSLKDIYQYAGDNSLGENKDEMNRNVEELAFQRFTHLLSIQQIVKAIDLAIRSLSCDWSLLINFIVYLCKSFPGEITRYVNESFEEAIAQQYSEIMIIYIILSRHLYSTKNKHMPNLPSYDTWLKNHLLRHFNSRKESSVPAKVLKKNREFILSVLHQMIPYDSVIYLKQIIPMLETALNCTDYITAVKNRLTTLGTSTDKFSVNHFAPVKSSTLTPIQEVKKALDDFATNNMTKIPQIVANKQYFDHSWYTKQFIPCLMTFEEHGQERTKYRSLVKGMVKLMVEKKMINPGLLREFERRIQEIENFEPENEEEDEELIVYSKEEAILVQEVIDKALADQKRFQSFVDELKEEAKKSLSLDRWDICFSSLEQQIGQINAREISTTDRKQYVDSIMILFCEVTHYIISQPERLSELDHFCMLFGTKIIYPFTQLYSTLHKRLTMILNHPQTTDSVFKSLGILLACISQLKYYKPQELSLPEISSQILRDFLPISLDHFANFALYLLKFCFTKFTPNSFDSLEEAFYAQQQVFIPSIFVLKAVWATERIIFINRKPDITNESVDIAQYQVLVSSDAFISFVRNRSIPLDIWIRCELVASKSVERDEFVDIARDRLFGRYLRDFDHSASGLLTAMMDEIGNCIVMSITRSLQLSNVAERGLMTVIQELQPLSFKTSPLIELPNKLMEKLYESGDYPYRFLEYYSKLVGMLDSRLLFGIPEDKKALETKSVNDTLTILSNLILSYSYVYPWPYQFVSLLVRGITDMLLPHWQDCYLDDDLSKWILSVPLLRVSLLKLWDSRHKVYIQALCQKLNSSCPKFASLVENALAKPIQNTNDFLELLFTNHQNRDSNTVVYMCTRDPVLFAVSLIEYSLCISCSSQTSSTSSNSYIFSQPSFSVSKLSEHTSSIPMQSIYSKVLSHLSVEKSKLVESRSDNQSSLKASITTFFVSNIFVLVHSLIQHTLFRLGGHRIIMAQFSEYGLKSMEELKTFATKTLIIYPELVLIFDIILKKIEKDNSYLNDSLLNTFDVPQLSNLLRIQDEQDLVKLRTALSSTFFVLVTRLSKEWIQNLLIDENSPKASSFLALFQKLYHIVDNSASGPDPKINIVSTIHKKKIKEFIEQQNTYTRELLLKYCDTCVA